MQEIALIREYGAKAKDLMYTKFSPVNWTILHHLFVDHLVDHMEYWGPIRDINMFAWESFFGYLTKKVKSHSLPVANIMSSMTTLHASNLCTALHGEGSFMSADIPLPPIPTCKPSAVGGEHVVELLGTPDRSGGPRQKEVRRVNDLPRDLLEWMHNHDEYRDMLDSWKTKRTSAGRGRDTTTRCVSLGHE